MLSRLSADRPEEPGFRLNRLFRPLAPGPLAVASLLVLVAGAAYCLGYQRLPYGNGHWGPSLSWSAGAIWPWLLLFEAIKRRLWSPRPLSRRAIAAAFVATAAASVLIEYAADTLNGYPLAPLALTLLRRLPAMATCFLLVELALQARALADKGGAGSEQGTHDLRVLAPDILWIRAAENYVELHGNGRTRIHRMTMREAAALFEPLDFVRIHRSFLVNRAHVDGFSRHGKRVFVTLRGGETLPVGKAFGTAVTRFVPSSHQD
jgi:DNA-binding LytR/AlgR family response regulator